MRIKTRAQMGAAAAAALQARRRTLA